MSKERTRLDFSIVPSPELNDHQVRILIDGVDWLEDDYLGIDPPEFFAQSALTEGGELLIGRCECGVIGCDDVRVTVARKGLGVLWRVREGVFYLFLSRDYDQLIESACRDFSWEDSNRTAERLVSDLFAGSRIEDGLSFTWASARIKPGTVTLMFSRRDEFRTFDFGWDGKDPESAFPALHQFLRERAQ